MMDVLGSLFVVCCLLFVDCIILAWCLRSDVCWHRCLFYVVCCVPCVMCCLLCVVCWAFAVSVVRCLFCAAFAWCVVGRRLSVVDYCSLLEGLLRDCRCSLFRLLLFVDCC